MRRPGPYICTPKDRFDDPDLQQAIDAMGKDPMRWYGVWDWLHHLAGNQHRVGLVCVTSRDARSMDLTLASVKRFAEALAEYGKVCDVEADRSTLCLTLTEWRDWQSLSPAERSWLRRQRDGASRDSVTASRQGDRDNINNAPTNAIASSHSRSAHEAAALAHAVARFGVGVDRVAAMVQDTLDDLDLTPGCAMLAAQSFVQRCQAGGVPDDSDRGLKQFLGMIETSGRVMGEAPRDGDRRAAGAGVSDYALQAIRGGGDD